jgi:hypothetical protein
MPRRDGDVFLLGTAISVSFSSLDSERWHRPERAAKALRKRKLENADEAALIEDDAAKG